MGDRIRQQKHKKIMKHTHIHMYRERKRGTKEKERGGKQTKAKTERE
jgi:hypothetical protein